MGLDAYVTCTCWATGMAKPFERPELVVDDDGPRLTLPYVGNEELHDRFDNWRDSACPHEQMRLASERISNWGGYRRFQERLAQLGWERFPTLHAELPQNNQGAMPATEAVRALEELGAFTVAIIGTEEVVLVDSDTDAVVRDDYVAAYGGVFEGNGANGLALGFDPEGIFVRRSKDQGGAVLFRAMRVDRPPCAFVDRDSGARLECPLDWGEGRRFHVTRRAAPVDRCRYIVEALETLCRAAIASGNPVIWT